MVNSVKENLSDLKEKNYVRKADPNNQYWFSFYVNKMQSMISQFGDNFFIIIYGDLDADDDYFAIPYRNVKYILTDHSTTRSSSGASAEKSGPLRWSGNIKDFGFHVTNSGDRIDIKRYYGNKVLLLQAMGHLDDTVENTNQIESEAADTTIYDPEGVTDARERTIRAITQRRGQKTFRDQLLDAYGRRCAITGCGVVDVLEAAHITPYLGPDTNHVTNGLLLRSDLHTLLDCGLLAIDPETHRVLLAPAIRESPDYKDLHGRPLRSAIPMSVAPSRKALEQTVVSCFWLTKLELLSAPVIDAGS